MRRLTFLSDEQRLSYAHLAGWFVIAIFSGALGAGLVAGFRWVLEHGQALIMRLPAPPPVVALIAALVTGLIVYRLSPDAAGEGIPSYLYALHHQGGRFPLSATLWKLPAALLSLVAYGSGGLVGPLGRVASGLASWVVGMTRRGEREGRSRAAGFQRTAAICGLSAVVSALFSAPIGAGIFAVEIIQRANMRYSDLFPSILAGTVAAWVAAALALEPIVPLLDLTPSIPISLLPLIVALSVIVAVLGGAFTRLYALAVTTFRRERGWVAPKVAIGMTASALLVWLTNPALFGGALPLLDSVLRADHASLYGLLPVTTPLVWAVLIAMVVRAFAACLTIGSGMSAGLVGPAALIGILAGVFAAALSGIAPGSSSYYALVATGFAGMLAGAMNVPIAAAVMTVEVFGLAFGLPAGLSVVVGFQINRHRMIYDFAVAGSGHLEEHEIQGQPL